MENISISRQCPSCNGTGKVSYGLPEESNCIYCGGTGKLEVSYVDVSSIMSKLDYIHGKVTAIWNKVK